MMTKKFRKSVVLFLTTAAVAGSTIACSGSKSAATEEFSLYDSYDTAASNSMAQAGGAMTDGGFYPEAVAETTYAATEAYAEAADYSSVPAAAAVDISNENEIVEQGTALAQPEENSSKNPASEPSSAGNQQSIPRKLIRTVSLNVETTDFDNLLTAIQQTVAADGGYTEQSDVSGSSISTASIRKRYAFLTVRIPSAKLDGFLSQMSEQSNVINRSESVQDVTLQYTDIESRKKSLTIEQERLWALLEKADTLEAVIALEERLSEIRYQLEGFESQLRTYDNQVDYSTVHISIQEVGVFTPTTPDSVGTRIQKGFVRNLENVIISLTDFLVWLISHLPALAVLAAIATGITILARKIIRVKKGKNQNISNRKQNKTMSGSPSPSQPDAKSPEDQN